MGPLVAIGEPDVIDTAKESRLGRIFMNRTIKIYPAFADFLGMEETIERIVGFFRHAAQGLEERKQVLYLLGPVGGGKSSLAERLKELIEEYRKMGVDAGKTLTAAETAAQVDRFYVEHKEFLAKTGRIPK